MGIVLKLKENVLALWFFVNILDAMSTWVAINYADAHEGNPVMAYLFQHYTLEGGLVIKVALALGAGYVISVKGNVQWMRIPTLLMALVAIHNSLQIVGIGI